MPNKLKSRKFWVLIAASAVITAGTSLGFPEDSVREVVAVAVAYLLGQGIADSGKANL